MFLKNLEYGEYGTGPVRDADRYLDDADLRNLLIQIADAKKLFLNIAQLAGRRFDVEEQHVQIDGFVVTCTYDVSAVLGDDFGCQEKGSGFIGHAGHKTLALQSIDLPFPAFYLKWYFAVRENSSDINAEPRSLNCVLML